MKKLIVIDGYGFEGEYSGVSDVENLNYHLEKKLNRYDIKEFMSRRHPELYPGHIGLHSDADKKLTIVLYKKGMLDCCGEYDHGWSVDMVDNPGKYIQDLFMFFEKNDPVFFNFIKDRIIM